MVFEHNTSMITGIPQEIKVHEYRCASYPRRTTLLTNFRHQALTQSNTGSAAGFSDQDYQASSVKIVPSA